MSDLVERREAASRYVAALFGADTNGLVVEIRFRVPSGMRQGFFSAGAPGRVVDAVLALSSRTDVFVGVLPRVRRGGRIQDVMPTARAAWADCDNAASGTALASFEPRPSMVVASGTGSHCHAYWLLSEPVAVVAIERLNRRLALALGADAGVVTKPHTILRPPGSLNWKHTPPAPVRLIAMQDGLRVSSEELDRRLPRTRPPVQVDGRERLARGPRSEIARDRLRSVPPRVYFERLTGLRVGRSGKVRCPLHELSVGRADGADVSPARSSADASSRDRGGPR
jgi:hypothetical protein